MARKVILDVDPGIDDALALVLALGDPRLEVEAVTAVAGHVSADQATRNVQAIIEQLDPARWPRMGAATDLDTGLPAEALHLFGRDGLGNADFAVAELHHVTPSEKIIADVARSSPNEVTFVSLGPLTNLARALKRSPELVDILDGVVMLGGTCGESGDVTAAAEFNIYCDPLAAREVFRAPITKTLLPLDITSQLLMTYDFLQQLPSDASRAGRLLRKLLPFAYRSHHQLLGLEGIYVASAVALALLVQPALFVTEEMSGEVETKGELTIGATVFDRRRRRPGRTNMEVVTQFDAAAVKDWIVRALGYEARRG